MSKFSKKDIGKRVHIPANKEEGWDDEYGKLVLVESRGMVLVEVDEEFLDSTLDDGIREVHEDDVEVES